jgi:predicted membrane-bound spermidine synthase
MVSRVSKKADVLVELGGGGGVGIDEIPKFSVAFKVPRIDLESHMLYQLIENLAGKD